MIAAFLWGQCTLKPAQVVFETITFLIALAKKCFFKRCFILLTLFLSIFFLSQNSTNLSVSLLNLVVMEGKTASV